MREQDVSLELLLGWLGERHGLHFAVEASEEPAPDVIAAIAGGDSTRLAVEVHLLLPPTTNDAWLALRDVLEAETSAGLPGAYALWLPPGADVPADARQRRDLAARVQEECRRLAPGERSYVPLPVSIFLRKQQEDGALISVSGGLSRYWARLSERARGAFDLDSTHLHRLPEPEEHLEQLYERIWEASTQIGLGQWVELETVDAWTVQRLQRGEEVAVVGRPPEELADVGLSVRRNFRRLLADAGPRLRGRPAGLRALVVTGFYARIEDEGATTAMRGYDPGLYAGLDFVCLAADGLIKPLLEARPPA